MRSLSLNKVRSTESFMPRSRETDFNSIDGSCDKRPYARAGTLIYRPHLLIEFDSAWPISFTRVALAEDIENTHVPYGFLMSAGPSLGLIVPQGGGRYG